MSRPDDGVAKGPTLEDAEEQLLNKIHAFLGDVGIGRPGGEGSTSERGFDAGPMVAFALQEGLAGESAEEIYRSWVEWQMEGAVERFDVVQVSANAVL
eukprot:SAG31_NODE_290_length_18324_cov_33.408889_16_plen_98_part_00